MNQNTPDSNSTARISVSPATVGSFVLLGAFFLPWVTILESGVAGYQLREIWAPGPYLWSIPIAAAVALLMGLSGKRNTQIAQVAGGLPLVFLAIALYQFGIELFKGLAFGGYITLVAGLFLLCVSPRLGRKVV